MTTPADTVHEISAWFAGVPHAGLILPTGWFGRPFDNSHQLTWSQARKSRLLLELDEELLLVLTAPGRPRIDAEGLAMTFGQLVFQWPGHSDFQPHASLFRGGELRFVDVGRRFGAP